MNNIFLVTSAIFTPYGKISVHDRISQTIDTAISIRDKVPNVKIYLVEGGKNQLPFELRAKFKEYYDDILDFTSHQVIQFAHKQNNDAGGLLIKAPCETYLLQKACALIKVTENDRIFKISGRYRLGDNFNLSDHHNAKGKYLFLNKLKPSTFEYIEQKGKLHIWTDYQYSTRLYSFCGSMIDKVQQNYKDIFSKIIEFYSTSNFIDLENTTYMILDPNDIVEVPVTGLEGCFADGPEIKINE